MEILKKIYDSLERSTISDTELPDELILFVVKTNLIIINNIYLFT